MGKQTRTRPRLAVPASSQSSALICADLRQKKQTLIAENRQTMQDGLAQGGVVSLADRQKVQQNLAEIRAIDETLRALRAA